MYTNTILEAKNVHKYFTDPVTIHVLHDINLRIQQSEFVSIVGKSGCGKSTLLYILSTMDSDYSGEVLVNGISMHNKSDFELAKVRNAHIGFVFQFHYLLNEFSVLKNVMLPALKLGLHPSTVIEDKAMYHLNQLGISHLASKSASQISGGEKQRVAIARALINDPLIIMGDEPTGNLDNKNTEIVFDIFQKLSQDYGQSLLIVTHDEQFAQRTSRIIEMADGKIISS